MQYTPIRSYRLGDVARFDPMTAVTVGLSAASAAVRAAGTLAGGDAALDIGRRRQQSMEYKAKLEEQAAQESRALAQRAALDKRHDANLMLSKVQARAAASGGGAADPSVLEFAGRRANQGEYNAEFETYKGENRARSLEDQATADRMTGETYLAEAEARKRASRASALSTILGGASSLFGRFGRM